MRLASFRTILTLALVFGTASFVTPPSRAQTPSALPSWFTVIEGGLPKADRLNSQTQFWGPVDIVQPSGWSGRLGFGQKNVSMGVFDTWGIYGSHSVVRRNIDDTSSAYSCNFYPCGTTFENYQAKSDTKRTAIDLELGSTLARGQSVFTNATQNSTSYLKSLLGLRATRYDQQNEFSDTTRFVDVTGFSYPFPMSTYSARESFRFQGAGPRIGGEARVGLSETLFLDARATAAVLYGRHTYDLSNFNFNGPGTTTYATSNNGWVTNFETSAALTYAPWGARFATISLGGRYDAWFAQRHLNSALATSSFSGAPPFQFVVPSQNKLTRTFEPFARLEIPLNGGTNEITVPMTAPRQAPGSARTFVTADGGLPKSDTLNQQSNAAWLKDDRTQPSGWSGRVGFGQTNVALGPLDYWGAFGSVSDVRRNRSDTTGYTCILFSCSQTDKATAESTSKRITLDLESGVTVARGIAAFSQNDEQSVSYVRALFGVRGTRFDQKNDYFYNSIYVDNGLPTNIQRIHNDEAFKFVGAGPSFGAAARLGITDKLFLDSRATLAALYGTHTYGSTAAVSGTNIYNYAYGSGFEKNGWVYNFNASAALTFAPSGVDGINISLGARQDSWWKQRNLGEFAGPVDGTNISFVRRAAQDKLVRSLEPFARVEIPLNVKN
jgi:Legionella pneumophila major outer membrane protein precursor